MGYQYFVQSIRSSLSSEAPVAVAANCSMLEAWTFADSPLVVVVVPTGSAVVTTEDIQEDKERSVTLIRRRGSKLVGMATCRPDATLDGARGKDVTPRTSSDNNTTTMKSRRRGRDRGGVFVLILPLEKKNRKPIIIKNMSASDDVQTNRQPTALTTMNEKPRPRSFPKV